MTILDTRIHFKPFIYDWAYDYYKQQSFVMNWNPDEISFKEDIEQFPKLSPSEQKFVKQIFTFFVQSDNDIGQGYVDAYLPQFKHPEIRMMLLSFANMESNHAQAYAKLMDTLGFKDYKGFLAYPEMKEKHDYFDFKSANDLSESKKIPLLMKNIAVTSAFGEGLQLFGSFVMLLSLVSRGYLPGMGSVVSYSLKDETIHCEGLIKIFNTIKSEYPQYWIDSTKRSIYDACRDMVELEDRFISLVYTDDLDLPNLPKEMLHKYIRFLADHRLNQLGLKPNYYVEKNPITWLEEFTSYAREDNFNNSKTEYSNNRQDWSDIW
jgi:ribonucleoside-diphosphate reductase beta chain